MNKYFILIMLILCFGCKSKNEKSTVVIQNEINPISISVLEEMLLKEYSSFTNENPLEKYGQIYLIDFKLEKNDTTITLFKTYKPVIIEGVTETEFKGGYFDKNNNPVIIMDNKKSLGERFYRASMLNNEILQKFDSIEQPSNIANKIKSKSYLIKDKRIISKVN